MSELELPVRWLLLRGLARQATHWFDFPDRLSARLERPCHAWDLPGIGQWSSVNAPTSVPVMARMLAERMTREHPAGHWGIVGISLGAMVTLAIAKLLPVSVERLVLINGSSRLSPTSQRLLPEGRKELLRAARIKDPLQRERTVLSVTTNPKHEDFTTWVEQSARLSREDPAKLGTAIRQLVGAARFRPVRVAQPTLILSGARDRLVSPTCSTALAHYLHAPHVVHPTAGHDLPLEEPEWAIGQIANWLDPNARRAAS